MDESDKYRKRKKMKFYSKYMRNRFEVLLAYAAYRDRRTKKRLLLLLDSIFKGEWQSLDDCFSWILSPEINDVQLDADAWAIVLEVILEYAQKSGKISRNLADTSLVLLEKSCGESLNRKKLIAYLGSKKHSLNARFGLLCILNYLECVNDTKCSDDCKSKKTSTRLMAKHLANRRNLLPEIIDRNNNRSITLSYRDLQFKKFQIIVERDSGSKDSMTIPGPGAMIMLVFFKNAMIKKNNSTINAYLSLSLRELTMKLRANINWEKLPRKINTKKRLSSYDSCRKFISQEIGRVNEIFESNSLADNKAKRLLLSKDNVIILRTRFLISSSDLEKFYNTNG